MSSSIITAKQRSILRVLLKGNEDGSLVDLDQILERISYETSKESLQFSVRFLAKRELIEKMPRELRRGRRRVVYKITELGEEKLVQKRRNAKPDGWVGEDGVVDTTYMENELNEPVDLEEIGIDLPNDGELL